MGCPDDNTILGFVEGLLSAEQTATLETHLDTCDACRRLVSTLAHGSGGITGQEPTEVMAADVHASPALTPATPLVETPGLLLRVGEPVDHYRILRPLGRGGMGTVWLARDTRLGRKVALKVVHAAALARPGTKERFLREARVTARFSHPHIVTLYSVGEHLGVPYLALEYLEGHTLRERLEEERLGLREGLRIGRAVASALADAHDHDVLHRDLKPRNVLLARDGRLRVLDFGLAKPVALQDEPPGGLPAASPARDAHLEATLPPYVTDHRAIFGTPAYMSPEQWRADGVGPAADVWALGVILHELLTGRRPLGRTPDGDPDAARALQKRVCDPTPLPSVRDAADHLPEPLIRLVDRCLAKDPTARPAATDVARELGDLLAGRDRGGTSAPAPFRGLLPFSERHAGLFYGRDTELDAFLERLREEPIVPILGPSGAGKSSFVLAGVIPRLREQGHWVVLRMRPGRHPFETLAARLERGESGPSRAGATRTGRRASPSGSQPSDPPPETAPPPSADPPEAPEPSLEVALREQPTRLALRLGQLAEAEQGRVLLFVDQLEELDTHVSDDATRRAFMEALCTAADDPSVPVRVIFTLRDDFLWRLAQGEAARQVLGRVEVLRPPGPDALTEILERTAEHVGFHWEPGLPAEMVAEVAEEGAALPLLQFAGQLIWERRDRETKTLTRAAYEAVGGVAGALAHHADGTLDRLTADQVRIARELFLRLVTPESTRRVALRSEVLADLGDEAGAVLDRLVSARAILVRKGLQASGEPELELVHESLIHSWDRLGRWLDESREERAFLTETGQAAALWDKRGRPEAEVWQGDALGLALRQAARCAQLPEPVARFLRAGQAREARATRRRRRLISAGMGGLALVALAAVAVSVALRAKEREAQRQRRRAQTEQREAHRQRAEAQRHEREAIRQRAMALLGSARAAATRGSLIEARAKLRAVLESHDSARARSLWRHLQQSPLRWRRRLGAFLYDVTFSPDGRLVAVACMDRAIYLFDRVTGATRVLRGHTDQIMAVAFAPDGRHLASSTWGGAVWIWDLATGRPRHMVGHEKGVMCLRFSHDGRRYATASSDNTVRIWDATTGRSLARLTGHTAPVRGLAFSPDDRLLATASLDRTVRLWNGRTGAPIRTLSGHTAPAWSVAFSPNGRLLASVGEDRVIRLWDPVTGQPRRVLRGHTARVLDVAFSPNGRLLASSSGDKTVRLWDPTTGKERARFTGHEAPVWGVAFSPDGTLVASVGEDRDLRLWSTTTPARAPPLAGHRGSIMGLAFHPKKPWLASGGVDHTIRLWDLATGHVIRVLTGHDAQVWSVAFDPTGTHLASASNDRTVRIWDLATGRTTAVLRGHSAAAFDVRFSPDGGRLASAGFDRTVRLWDAATGRELAVLRGHTAQVHDVAFSPDGRRLASTSADQTVRIWDLATHRCLDVLRGHQATVRGVSFSPDGTLLASAGVDKRVRIWDLRSGRGRLVRTLGPHPGRVYGVAFHPDGRHLGVPCSDGTAWIWDLKTGTRRVLRGHQAEVNIFRFGPRGRLAATASDDGTVRLWDVATGHAAWRSPLLYPAPLSLLTHRGWQRLGPSSAASPSSATPAHARRWRRAVQDHAVSADVAPFGPPAVTGPPRVLCLRDPKGALELWDLKRDRLAQYRKLAGLTRVVATPDGCLTLAKGEVGFQSLRDAPLQVVARFATALSADASGFQVYTDGAILEFDRAGHRRRRLSAPAGVTALVRDGPWYVLGFGDGGVELWPAEPGRPKPRLTFGPTPASPVLRLLPGPPGTLAVGFANGEFGLYSLDKGTRLEHGRLHGPVVHLRRHGDLLVAATDLGQYRVLDLGPYHLARCALLRQVWRAVPVVWADGLPRRRPPPTHHPCAARSAPPATRP